MLESSLKESIAALNSLTSLATQIDAAAEAIVKSLQAGGGLYCCGNGGSAAESQHFTTELLGRFRSNRRPLKAVSLTADPSLLTCIGNDFGWDEIFARQVQGMCGPNDVLCVFSTSGNSPNIQAALKAARTAGCKTIAVLGKSGGGAKGLADFELIVGSQKTGAIQEAHLFLVHYFCERIEDVFA